MDLRRIERLDAEQMTVGSSEHAHERYQVITAISTST